MATWYEARESTWQPEINAVEVERSTENSVYIRGRRNARSSSYASYFPTWEEAHEYLLKWAERRLETSRISLQRAYSLHGNIKGMKKPADA